MIKQSASSDVDGTLAVIQCRFIVVTLMIQSRVKQIKEAKAVQHIPCLLVEAKPIVTINQNPSTDKWRDAIERPKEELLNEAWVAQVLDG